MVFLASLFKELLIQMKQFEISTNAIQTSLFFNLLHMSSVLTRIAKAGLERKSLNNGYKNMPKYTYSAMERVPESELVRIGYKPLDTLETVGCRTCGQKMATTAIPFMAAFVYFKEYQLKYGHYPILRATAALPMMTVRQSFHFLLPVSLAVVGLWWSELTYNRCVLGVQGAEPLPDQIIKRGTFP